MEDVFTFDGKALERSLIRIYEKKFRPLTDIERNLFTEFCRAFDKATDKAFPDISEDSPDKAFYDALKSNNAVFAAFKTHRAQNDIAAQLLDEKGDLKPFSRFSNDVQTIVDHHCRRWLDTEYNTAIARAQFAADWQVFLRDKDLFPNLEWLRSTSITPGLDHVPFWGMIRPIEDVFWTQHHPKDRWGCKCRLRSTDKEPTEVPDAIRPVDRPSPGLDNNPGVDGKLFSDSHPYIANARFGAKEAVEKFIKILNEQRKIGVFQRKKSYKSGGELYIHSRVDTSKSDYKDLYTIGNLFAKEGKTVRLTPAVHFKSNEYRRIYGALEGTRYERKCPDLEINGVFYEYESFVKPWKKGKVGNMLKHGFKQSSFIIINNTKGANDRYLKRLITIYTQQTQVDEVWVYDKGKVRLLYKNREK